MISVTINGTRRDFDGDAATPLLWYLRDELGLTGTKFGCGIAACGACTVHLEGQAVRSCVTPVSAASGKRVVTIEGLSPDGSHPVQRAWRAHNVPQCGYCQSGQIMQAAALACHHTPAHRLANRPGDGRQHLPVRNLRPYPVRNQGRGRREVTMDSITKGMERREFVQLLGGGGLVLVVSQSGCRRVSDSLRGAPKAATSSVSPAAYLRIDDAGGVTVVCHRSEMGQGVRTSVAMIVADELDADWDRVKVEQAPGDEKTFGSQNTDGSRSIREFLDALRKLARPDAPSSRLPRPNNGVCRSRRSRLGCTRSLHRPSGRKLGYGDLVETARKLPVPAPSAIRLKTPEQFRYIGKEVPIVDLLDMTTGRAQYGMDLRRDGMLVAVIARPPVYGGSLKSVDSADAEKIPGVVRIVKMDSPPPPSGFLALGGVAVLGRNTWAAMQGRQALKLVWNDGPNATYDSEQYRAELERSARRPGKVVRNQGDVNSALRRAAKRVQADYYIPHLGHAQMEPLAALASFENGKCEIWAPTQHPQAARDTVALALKIPVDDVQVHVTLLGGGFGRKSKPDFIVEAALLARETGKPVKVDLDPRG